MTAIDTPARRRRAAELLGDARTVDDPSLRVVLTADEHGAASWYEDGSGVAKLGAVASDAGLPAFYYAVLATALDAQALGYTRAQFLMNDAGLLALLARHFRIEPAVVGRLNGEPKAWSVEVDLVDAVAQLTNRLAKL